MSLSRSPPAVDCRNARRWQLPIAWLIHHPPEPGHYRHCSVPVMHQLLCISLSRLSSFRHFPVPCLPSPLHVLWNATCRTIFPFSLSFLSFLNLYLGFFTQWSSFWAFGKPHLSLLSPLSLSVSPWCCHQPPWSSPLTTVSFSLLLVSYVYFHELWILPYQLIPRAGSPPVLSQINLHPFMFPVLSFAVHVLRVLSIRIKLNICLTYFTCCAPQQAFPVFHKGWIICSSLEDSPAPWHTQHCVTTFISQSFP